MIRFNRDWRIWHAGDEVDTISPGVAVTLVQHGVAEYVDSTPKRSETDGVGKRRTRSPRRRKAAAADSSD